MNKLRLRLDDLSIESFDTSTVRNEKGTVFGEQQCTCPTACTCPGCDTCEATCAYTCDDRTCDGQATCAPTCAFTCAYESCHPVDCGRSYEYAFCQQYP